MKFLRKLLIFLIPVIVPLIILTCLSVFFALHDIKKDTINYNLSLLMQTRDNIDLMLNELDTLSYSFDPAANPDVSNIVRNVFERSSHTYDSNLMFSTMTAFLSSYAHNKPYAHSIYIYYDNQNRHFLTTTEGIVSLNNYGDNQWIHLFEEPKPGSLYRSESRTILSPSLGQATPIITITKRFISTNGGVVLNLYPKYIQNAITRTNQYANQSLIIFNENNEVLFKQLSNKFPKQLHTSQFINEDEFYRYRLGEDDFAVFKIHSEKYDWTYVTLMPWSIFFQIPNKIIITTLFLSLGMLVIGTALATYLLRRDHNRTRLEQSYLQMQLSERKYKLKAMELLALQSQMNPHFLFNTLETMNWKAIRLTGQPNELNAMIDHLSAILRYSLNSHTESVPLADEINNTKHYIDILKNRHKNKFDVIWEYDESEIINYHAPKMLLQPLVENAIYHGIREKDGHGRLKIKMYTWQKHIRITLIDNGLGISAERLHSLQKLLVESDEPSKHIGLINTARRLKLAYGEDYGLTIKSKPTWGTVIIITLPIHYR